MFSKTNILPTSGYRGWHRTARLLTYKSERQRVLNGFSMNEHARLPASLFDDFVAGRPDEERWELIEGSFVMQATPSFDHQIIARNIERLLSDALERDASRRFAIQNPSIDLSPVLVGSRFVPDVAVLDLDDLEPDRHTATRCYLAVEVVSTSDRQAMVRRGRPRLEIKRDGYANLPDCEVILIVEPKRYAVEIGQRQGDVWTWRTLSAAQDDIVLPTFGLRCRLGDFYASTTLALGIVKRKPKRS